MTHGPTVSGDTFGRLLNGAKRALNEGRSFFPEVVEWNSGHVSVGNALRYFAPFTEWPVSQQHAVRSAGRRVLDVGAGAGRHSRYLADQGIDVVSIDIDPVAVELMRQLGLDARVGDLRDHQSPARYDTILLLGGNGSLLLGDDSTLDACSQLLTEGGSVIAEVASQSIAHGGTHVRVRFDSFASPWIHYEASLIAVFREQLEVGSDFEVAAWTTYRSTTLVTLTKP